MLERVRVGSDRCERLGARFRELVQSAGAKMVADLQAQLNSMDDIASIFEAGIKKLDGPDKPEARDSGEVTEMPAIAPPSPDRAQ